MKKVFLLALFLLSGVSMLGTAVATMGPGVGCRVIVAPEGCNKEQTQCGFYVVKYGSVIQVNLGAEGKTLMTLHPGDSITIMGIPHKVEKITRLSNGDVSIEFVHTAPISTAPAH